MGDDLTTARRFCDNVRGDMSALIDAVCTQPCAAPDVLIDSLDRIQSGAKRLHARAIFRAAQTVVNAVNDSAPLPALQGRILTLNKLIVQYETGLDDIMPRPANGDDAPLEIKDSALVFAAAAPPMPDIDARFRAARAALAPLMGFAKPGQESEALTRLARFSDDDIIAVKTQSESLEAQSDILLETLFEDGPEMRAADTPLVDSQADTAHTFTPRARAATAVERADTAQLDFETLMPDLISCALQEARQTDKTVSVSYAAEGVSFSASQLPALQSLFAHIAKTLVHAVLELPETRRQRGASGAGHIAITAAQQAATLSVSIECAGRAQTVSAFIPAGQVIEGLLITPGQNAGEGHTHIVLTVPRKAPSQMLTQAGVTGLNPQSAEMAS